MRFGKPFFLVVFFICIFETIRLWFLAPLQMASHFNKQGMPDGYMSKAGFFASQGQVALVVIGLGLLIQVMILIIPTSWINTPNRDYWLRPEHRNEMVEALSSFGAALFGVILLVVQVGFDLSVYANLQEPVHFSAQIMLLAIGGFFIISIILLFELTRYFLHPPSDR